MTMKNRKLQLKIKPGALYAPPTPLLPSFPFPSPPLFFPRLFICASSVCFAHLHPRHETCQRVNSHTPGLHSTLMLSHDKLLSLSLISNLLLLLFPLLSLSLSHKMSLFRLKPFDCRGRQARIPNSLTLTHGLLTSTSVTLEFSIGTQ